MNKLKPERRETNRARFIAAERQRRMVRLSAEVQAARLRTLDCCDVLPLNGQPVDNPAKEKALHRCKALIFWLPGADSNHGPSD